MCDPLTIAGLLLTVGGGAAGVVASSDERNAMNQATENELNRQQQYAKQGQSIFENSLNQSTPQAVQNQIGQGTQRALAGYQQLQNQQVPGFQQGLTQVNPSKSFNATENALTNAKIGQQNNAGAALQGYQASGVQQGIKDLSARTGLNQIGSFAQASENVLPLELQAAANSRSGLAGLGSLASTAGGLMSLYGAINPTSGPSLGLGGQAIQGYNPAMFNGIQNQPLAPLNWSNLGGW